MPETAPTSFRISSEARQMISECSRLSGLRRAAVVETAIREYHERLAMRAKLIRKVKGG